MRYNDFRRKTNKIKIGNVYIGGDAPIAIQSMTNTDTHDAKATLEQIKKLSDAGCDIVRIAVPDVEAAETVKILKVLMNLKIQFVFVQNVAKRFLKEKLDLEKYSMVAITILTVILFLGKFLLKINVQNVEVI